MAAYEFVLVDRTMGAAAAPTFVEVEALVGVPSFSWQRRISGPGQASLSLTASQQAQSVKDRLMDLTRPTELWVRRDTELIFAGPLVGVQVQGPTFTLTVPDLSALMWRWAVEPGTTLTYTGTDQHLIAKGLVDYWQGLSYGNFGIVTSGVTASGTTRDRVYDGSDTIHIIGQRLTELGEVLGGFEWTVDPDRTLRLATPGLGSDKSGTVIVDGRSILSGNAVWSAGPRDFGTVAHAWSGGEEPLTASSVNATLLASVGRLALLANAEGVTTQPTMDDKADWMLAAASEPLYWPSPEVAPIGDIAVEDFDLGDTITVEYDYGMGLVTAERRVGAYRVSVNAGGTERIALELI